MNMIAKMRLGDDDRTRDTQVFGLVPHPNPDTSMTGRRAMAVVGKMWKDGMVIGNQ